MSSLSLIAARRKYFLVAKIVATVAVFVGVTNGLIGNYLPVELWLLVFVFLFASSIFGVIRMFVVASYRKRHKMLIGEHDNFVLGMNSLTTLLTFMCVGASIFIIFNIEFKSFLTSISLVAVALVLIFRDYISNYLDSFRLMFSTDYQIGDYIKVSEFAKGAIMDITFRVTKLKTDEGDMLFIPNTRLMTSEVVNYSKTKFKPIIIPFTLPTNAVKTVAVFENALKKAIIAAFPDSVQEKKIFLHVANINNWQTSFKCEVRVHEYNFTIEDEIMKMVYVYVLEKQASKHEPKAILLGEE